MSSLSSHISKAINCYKVHPDAISAQQLVDIFTKLYKMIQLAYENNQAQKDLLQILDLLDSAIKEIEAGTFWQSQDVEKVEVIDFRDVKEKTSNVLYPLFDNCVNF